MKRKEGKKPWVNEMNTRSINVTMSEYSNNRNWKFLKSSCFVSEKRFAFIAIISAENGITIKGSFKGTEGIRVDDLDVEVIWKDKDNRFLRSNTLRNLRKINGENRMLACDCSDWGRDFKVEDIASAEVIITDRKSSFWNTDDTIRWDVV